MFTVRERWSGFNRIKEIGMIADLFQLHQHVEQSDFLCSTRFADVNDIDVAWEDVFVKLLLHSTHANEQVNFFFWQ